MASSAVLRYLECNLDESNYLAAAQACMPMYLQQPCMFAHVLLHNTGVMTPYPSSRVTSLSLVSVEGSSRPAAALDCSAATT